MIIAVQVIFLYYLTAKIMLIGQGRLVVAVLFSHIAVEINQSLTNPSCNATFTSPIAFFTSSLCSKLNL